MRKTVILASASPRRELLLKKLVKSFRVIPSRVDESRIKAKTPTAFAVKAALAKAEDIARQHPSAIVIGSDTIVVLGAKILGKPRTKREAFCMLRSLAGRTHRVITGVGVVCGQKKIAGYEITRVKMKKVKDQVIHDYIATGGPMDKAGAYGIQEIEDIFIENIKGDYDNVVGLPVKLLKKLLSDIIK